MSTLIETDPGVHSLRREHSDRDALTAAILDHLNEQTVISLDSLIYLLPQYTWNQIFHRVDQLARCHTIILRRHGFQYMIFSINFVA
jgi:hypothetical protein